MTTDAAEETRPLVLVAEDEPLVRDLAVEILEDDGLDVVAVEHADAAISVLEARAAEFNVLFTDVNMPGSIDGLRLAHHVAAHWPWIGLLICSGRPLPEQASIPAKARFLPKPYHPRQAVDQVRRLASG